MALRQMVGFGFVVAVVSLTGCGSSDPTPGTLVDITGNVTANGIAVKNVTVQLQPTGGAAQQAALKVGADGTFSGKVMAGKYSWYLTVTEGGKLGDRQKSEAAMKAIPVSFKEASLERQIDVKGGTPLDLQVK